MNAVEKFIQYLVHNGFVKAIVNEHDPDLTQYEEVDGFRVEFDGVGILELQRYENGYMAVMPCGEEHLDEVTLTAKNIKKFSVYKLTPVNLDAALK